MTFLSLITAWVGPEGGNDSGRVIRVRKAGACEGGAWVRLLGEDEAVFLGNNLILCRDSKINIFRVATRSVVGKLAQFFFRAIFIAVYLLTLFSALRTVVCRLGSNPLRGTESEFVFRSLDKGRR